MFLFFWPFILRQQTPKRLYNSLLRLTSYTQLNKNVCKGHLPAVMFHLSLWYMLTLQILALVVLTVGNDWRSWWRMDNWRCGGEMSMRRGSVLHRVWMKVVLPWAVCLWTLVANTCRKKIILYFYILCFNYIFTDPFGPRLHFLWGFRKGTIESILEAPNRWGWIPN